MADGRHFPLTTPTDKISHNKRRFAAVTIYSFDAFSTLSEQNECTWMPMSTMRGTWLKISVPQKYLLI